MIGSLLDRLEATLCIDAKRVYSAGMSDGGATTSVLACRLADRFAAFGPVAVIVYVDGCGGDHPVSIAGFQGTADPIVPFNGGEVSCCGHPTLGAAPDAMAGWAKHDGCRASFADETLGTEVTKRTWSGCTGQSDVVFYIINGGGHTWPGAAIPIAALGLTTQQIKASETIWDFFKAHPLES
jgi:polyhydroxybutyrate depolymerase